MIASEFFKILIIGFDEMRQQFRYHIGKILRFLPLDMHVRRNVSRTYKLCGVSYFNVDLLFWNRLDARVQKEDN